MASLAVFTHLDDADDFAVGDQYGAHGDDVLHEHEEDGVEESVPGPGPLLHAHLVEDQVRVRQVEVVGAAKIAKTHQCIEVKKALIALSSQAPNALLQDAFFRKAVKG